MATISHERAERFLIHLAESMRGADAPPACGDVAAAARRLAGLLSARSRAGDLDPVLDVIEDALKRERDDPGEGRPGPPAKGETDPYFFG